MLQREAGQTSTAKPIIPGIPLTPAQKFVQQITQIAATKAVIPTPTVVTTKPVLPSPFDIMVAKAAPPTPSVSIPSPPKPVTITPAPSALLGPTPIPPAPSTLTIGRTTFVQTPSGPAVVSPFVSRIAPTTPTVSRITTGAGLEQGLSQQDLAKITSASMPSDTDLRSQAISTLNKSGISGNTKWTTITLPSGQVITNPDPQNYLKGYQYAIDKITAYQKNQYATSIAYQTLQYKGKGYEPVITPSGVTFVKPLTASEALSKEEKTTADIIKNYGLQSSYQKAYEERSIIQSKFPEGFVGPIQPGPLEKAFNAKLQVAYQQYQKDIAWEGWQKLPTVLKENIRAASAGIVSIGNLPVIGTVYGAITGQTERQKFESYYLPTAQKLQYIAKAPLLEKVSFALFDTLPGIYYTGMATYGGLGFVKGVSEVGAKVLGAGLLGTTIGTTGYGAYQTIKEEGLAGLPKFALTTGVSFAVGIAGFRGGRGIYEAGYKAGLKYAPKLVGRYGGYGAIERPSIAPKITEISTKPSIDITTSPERFAIEEARAAGYRALPAEVKIAGIEPAKVPSQRVDISKTYRKGFDLESKYTYKKPSRLRPFISDEYGTRGYLGRQEEPIFKEPKVIEKSPADMELERHFESELESYWKSKEIFKEPEPTLREPEILIKRRLGEISEAKQLYGREQLLKSMRTSLLKEKLEVGMLTLARPQLTLQLQPQLQIQQQKQVQLQQQKLQQQLQLKIQQPVLKLKQIQIQKQLQIQDQLQDQLQIQQEQLKLEQERFWNPWIFIPPPSKKQPEPTYIFRERHERKGRPEYREFRTPKLLISEEPEIISERWRPMQEFASAPNKRFKPATTTIMKPKSGGIKTGFISLPKVKNI